MDRSPSDEQTGRYAYDGLDRVLHEKARLGILTSLAAHPEGLLFGDLKDLCILTDGNLSRHLQVLQEAALVRIDKGYAANRPQTRVRLTEKGRKRFVAYIEELQRVLSDAHAARSSLPRKARSTRRRGYSAT